MIDLTEPKLFWSIRNKQRKSNMNRLVVILVIAFVALLFTISAKAENNNVHVECNPKVVQADSCCKQECKPEIKTVIKYKTKEVIKQIEKPVVVEKIVKEKRPRNAISLLGGREYTGLDIRQSSVLQAEAKTHADFAVGLMYQRSIGNFRLSGIATTKAALFLGLGYEF